jgi:hypothetical protein
MRTQLLFCRPRLFQRVGNASIAGLQTAIWMMALALSSVTAQATWPWFSGYIDPGNSYRIYAYTDWDTPLFGSGIYPDIDCLGISPPDHRVDGHMVFKADGSGSCTIIEATGSCSVWLGQVFPVSIQFSQWFSNPSSPPASDTRHDWSSDFLNILSDPVPTLTIMPSGTNCLFFWPTNAQGFSLQSSTNLLAGSWSDVTNSTVTMGTDYSVTLSATQVKSFFRLKK